MSKSKTEQLDLLENYLKNKKIRYERTETQIVVFNLLGQRQWDVVCNSGSYGYEDGLLEAMGSPIVGYSDEDDVVGFLTAQDVIDRLEGKR